MSIMKAKADPEHRTFLTRQEAFDLLHAGRRRILPHYIRDIDAFMNHVGFFKPVTIGGQHAIVYAHDYRDFHPEKPRKKLAIVKLCPKGEKLEADEMLNAITDFSNEYSKTIIEAFSLIGTNNEQHIFRNRFVAYGLREGSHELRRWHLPALPGDLANPSQPGFITDKFSDVIGESYPSSAHGMHAMARQYFADIMRVANGKHPVRDGALVYLPWMERTLIGLQNHYRRLRGKSEGAVREAFRIYEIGLQISELLELKRIPSTLMALWNAGKEEVTAWGEYKQNKALKAVSEAAFQNGLSDFSRVVKPGVEIDFNPSFARELLIPGIVQCDSLSSNHDLLMAAARLPRIGDMYDFTHQNFAPTVEPTKNICAIRRLSPHGLGSVRFVDGDTTETWVFHDPKASYGPSAKILPELQKLFSDANGGIIVFRTEAGRTQLKKVLSFSEASALLESRAGTPLGNRLYATIDSELGSANRPATTHGLSTGEAMGANAG